MKTYQQSVGPMRFIGKKYVNEDRGPNGLFSNQWQAWFQNGWFDVLKRVMDVSFLEAYPEGIAEIGLMRERDGTFDTFEYWIGYFMRENTAVPDGFDFVDFPESRLGVCWVHGTEDEVFGQEAACLDQLKDEGMQSTSDWCFERYVPERFESPDENGRIILDICCFIA